MGNGIRIWSPHPALATLGFQGLQVTFSLLSGQSVQHLKLHGLSPTEIAIIVLSGPICGATFQPYFGIRSDRCHSVWGRRRPFIVIGTTFLITSMLCLAWVDSIVHIILLRSWSPSSLDVEQLDAKLLQSVVMVVALLCMFIINAATQALQVGLRALITDYGTLTQQAEANTWAGRHVNFAAVLAFSAAYLDFPQHFGIQGKSKFASMGILTAIYLLLSVMTTCFCVSETPYGVQEDLDMRQGLNLKTLRNVFSNLTREIKLVFLVQFLAWFGWFPFLFYIVTYYFHIETAKSGERYRDLGSLAPLSYSLVALLVAIVLPSGAYGKKESIKMARSEKLSWHESISNPYNLWIASQGVFAISMLGATFAKSPLEAVILFSVVGFSWAISSRVPYSILSNELCSRHPIEDGEQFLTRRQGLIHGLHNVAICLPQIIIMLLMGVFFKITEENGNSGSRASDEQFLDVALFLRLGGLFSLAATYYATKLGRTTSVQDEYECQQILMEETRRLSQDFTQDI
ncbi:hypothetical protein TMatcc_005240 [Talaromyces marneffei ATCC 18224]